MEVIHVPRPSKKAMNPERPANALLLSQVSHLQHAERRLPLRYRTKIYTRAIETEGEAAEYIREVTEAIHQAHADAAKRRARHARRPVIEIAAAADEGTKRKSRSKAKAKSGAKRGRKKRGDPPGGVYAVEWDVSAVGCFHTGIGSRESAAGGVATRG